MNIYCVKVNKEVLISPESRVESHSGGMSQVRLDKVLPVASVQQGNLQPLQFGVCPI